MDKNKIRLVALVAVVCSLFMNVSSALAFIGWNGSGTSAPATVSDPIASSNSNESAFFASSTPSTGSMILSSDPPVGIPSDNPMENVTKLQMLEEQSYNGGLLLRVPLTQTKAAAFTAAQQSISQLLPGITTFIITDGSLNALMIKGNDADSVKSAKEQILFMLGAPRSMPRCLVDMSAMLKQFTETDITNLGLPLIPMTIQPSGSLSANKNWGPNANVNGLSYNLDSIGTWNPLSLYNNNSIGKVLDGTNAMTNNGIACLISSQDNQPILVSQSGSQTTSTQQIQTSVQVTPTVLSYDPDNITKSIVKLDVVIQLSIPTGSSPAGISFTQKNLTTSRIVRADGSPVIAGSFISDQNTPSEYYIPILGHIPLLGYFFSYKTNTIEREASILLLTVRLIPEVQ